MGKGRDARVSAKSPEGQFDEWVEQLRTQNFERPLSQLESGWSQFKQRMEADAALAQPLRDADDRELDKATLLLLTNKLQTLVDEVNAYANS